MGPHNDPGLLSCQVHSEDPGMWPTLPLMWSPASVCREDPSDGFTWRGVLILVLHGAEQSWAEAALTSSSHIPATAGLGLSRHLRGVRVRSGSQSFQVEILTPQETAHLPVPVQEGSSGVGMGF